MMFDRQNNKTRNMLQRIRKTLALLLSFVFLFSQAGFAQVATELNFASHLAQLHNTIFPDKFRPLYLRYFSYDNVKNEFKVFLDKGDEGKLDDIKLKENTQVLLKYFLIGVTLPDDAFWVNLRPDAEDNIVDAQLATTDIGKVLLEADVQLKKDTAKFTSPQTPEGKAYWDKLYQKAAEIYGSENISIPALTRPWIVPNEIIIRESKDGAYIYKASLKVMLEQDHLKNSATYNFSDTRARELNEYSSQLIRELIIPKLTKEVNISKRYASLRQVYYSLILARWFKARFNGRGGYYTSLINRGNLTGLTSQESWSKTTYFKEYQKSFKDGEYNLRAQVSGIMGQSIRSYFSGGIDFGRASSPLSSFLGDNVAVEEALFAKMTGFTGTPDGALAKVEKASSSANQKPQKQVDKRSDMLRELHRQPKDGPLERQIRGRWLNGTLDIRNIPKDVLRELNLSSSPVSREAIEKTVQTLAQDRFEERIRALYGKTREEAERIDPELAEISLDFGDPGNENRLGWTLANVEWLLQNYTEVENVLSEAEEIRQGNYQNVILCGMGGSGLSVQTVKTTFDKGRGMRIYSLRTTDPAVIAGLLKEIASFENGSLRDALEKTWVIAVSKTAKTRETNTHKEYFEKLYEAFKIEVSRHVRIVTDDGTPWTKENKGYKRSDIQLNKQGDIGGRFTAPTTRIFLLPLALVLDKNEAPGRIRHILERTKAMNDVSINNDEFFKLAAFLYLNATNPGKIRDKVALIMPDELRELPLWSEELFEESLGKGGKGVTLFYGENLSPEVLHPAESNDRVFLRINLKGKKTNEKLWKYLSGNGYPVFEINVEDSDDIGGLMLGFQRTVAAIAYLWKIPFVHQPAVNGYKDVTNAVMNKFEEDKKKGAGKDKIEVSAEWKSAAFKNLKLYYEPLIRIGAVSEEELRTIVERLGTNLDNAAAVYAATLDILSRKPGFEAVELTSYGKMTTGLRSILESQRFRIFTKGLKMPSKLGEGPDKNHSYQQNIEDGRNLFFSTYFMPLKIQQPADVFGAYFAPGTDNYNALIYDDNLLRAQTIGTVESMIKNNRKVVLITADSTTEEAETEIDEFFNQVDGYLGQLGTKEASISSPLSEAAARSAIEGFVAKQGWLNRRAIEGALKNEGLIGAIKKIIDILEKSKNQPSVDAIEVVREILRWNDLKRSIQEQQQSDQKVKAVASSPAKEALTLAKAFAKENKLPLGKEFMIPDEDVDSFRKYDRPMKDLQALIKDWLRGKSFGADAQTMAATIANYFEMRDGSMFIYAMAYPKEEPLSDTQRQKALEYVRRELKLGPGEKMSKGRETYIDKRDIMEFTDIEDFNQGVAFNDFMHGIVSKELGIEASGNVYGSYIIRASSSPSSNKGDLGGIDFRQMNIIAQPMGSFTGLNFSLPKINNAANFDIDQELKQINDMVAAGMIPSAERLKECLAVCYAKKELGEYAGQMSACLIDICKLQEDQVSETNSGLKEVLVMLDLM